VIIDRQSLRDSRGWIILSLLTLLACTIWYFIYAAGSPQGASAGSRMGLTIGSIGTAIIIFEWALRVRKGRR
jgi:hypothetical protein